MTSVMQEPIEDGGTYHFFKDYFLGLNFRVEYPHNSDGQKYGAVPTF